MKILAIVVFYLSTTASAAGWAGALQWVWIYFAYQIDLLNSPAQRTIGLKCRSWDNVQKVCRVPRRGPQWKPCTPRRPRFAGDDECSFNELMKHEGVMDPQVWEDFEAYRPDGRLDARQTAINLYNAAEARRETIENKPPLKWVRDGGEEYNDGLRRVIDATNANYRTHRTADNQILWDLFDGVHDDMVIARVGDHEPNIIDAARTAVGNDIELHTQNLGQNPVNAEKPAWIAIDWKTTVEEAEKAGVADAAARCFAFIESRYGPPFDTDSPKVREDKKAARDHLMVIESLKRGQDQRVTCR